MVNPLFKYDFLAMPLPYINTKQIQGVGYLSSRCTDFALAGEKLQKRSLF
ncbi:MAG: hypothetical protein PUP93_29970 [Rhizonema sp. NSF051]|nr:hypothetical protein [Rhizonema sp. NSF051]